MQFRSHETTLFFGVKRCQQELMFLFYNMMVPSPNRAYWALVFHMKSEKHPEYS